MVRNAVSLVALCSWAVGCMASWKPADGVVDLDGVEKALRKVENATLSPEQRKVAARVVGDVDRVVAQLTSDKKLTKVEKMKKAKAAIEEMQGLQSQWELAAVEGALAKITDLSQLSAGQRIAARKVVAAVEATVKEVEAGKLTGAARHECVAFAIQGLQSLEREWTNVATAARVDAPQRELAAQKALLQKHKMELKLAGLEKEWAENNLMLQKLTEMDQIQVADKQRKEDAAQEAMVARLWAAATALMSKAKNKTQQQRLPPDAILAAFASDLQATERNLSAWIVRRDAEEKVHEAEMARAVEVAAKTPAQGKMLGSLLKQKRRSYLKTRALKEAQRKELEEGIRSIQRRDAAGIDKLMQKMQMEEKALQTKSKRKHFLY